MKKKKHGGAERLLTQFLPYISDRGARISGYYHHNESITKSKKPKIIRPTPIATASRNILKVKARIVGFVIWYLIATSGKPGAIIELASGDTNVYNDTCEERKKEVEFVDTKFGKHLQSLWPSIFF